MLNFGAVIPLKLWCCFGLYDLNNEPNASAMFNLRNISNRFQYILIYNISFQNQWLQACMLRLRKIMER